MMQFFLVFATPHNYESIVLKGSQHGFSRRIGVIPSFRPQASHQAACFGKPATHLVFQRQP